MLVLHITGIPVMPEACMSVAKDNAITTNGAGCNATAETLNQ